MQQVQLTKKEISEQVQLQPYVLMSCYYGVFRQTSCTNQFFNHLAFNTIILCPAPHERDIVLSVMVHNFHFSKMLGWHHLTPFYDFSYTKWDCKLLFFFFMLHLWILNATDAPSSPAEMLHPIGRLLSFIVHNAFIIFEKKLVVIIAEVQFLIQI